MTEKPYEILDYRGQHIEFFDCDLTQSYWCEWEGTTWDFGAYNLCYAADMIRVIDNRFDTIYRWSNTTNFFGCALMWHYAGEWTIRLMDRMDLVAEWHVSRPVGYENSEPHKWMNPQLINKYVALSEPLLIERRKNETR